MCVVNSWCVYKLHVIIYANNYVMTHAIVSMPKKLWNKIDMKPIDLQISIYYTAAIAQDQHIAMNLTIHTDIYAVRKQLVQSLQLSLSFILQSTRRYSHAA